MNRLPASAFVAAAVAVVGFAGLIRGAVPQAASGGLGGAATDPIVVSGAYVREPASPDVAAAYFTVYNTTGVPDALLSVTSGAGGVAELHTYVNGVMTAVSGAVAIPAHGSLVLTTGGPHVMISKLIGTVKAGQTVTLELLFQNAGPITVSAPVLAYGTPAPGSATTGATK
jgi:copper(I)-binding protein